MAVTTPKSVTVSVDGRTVQAQTTSANVAELLMSRRGAFITGADFLVDGGATASFFYGPLRAHGNPG